jgi:hypothetical protein
MNYEIIKFPDLIQFTKIPSTLSQLEQLYVAFCIVSTVNSTTSMPNKERLGYT